MQCRFLTAILAGGLLLTPWAADAQSASGTSRPTVEAAFTYETLHANVVPGQTFWMQGAAGQMSVPLGRGFGVAGSGSGFHAAQMGSTGVGLDLYTLTIGPRFTFAPRRHRASIYAQCLVGQVWGRNSLFPTSTGVEQSDSGLALETGGGVTLRTGHHTAFRLIEGAWVRSELGNATTGVQYSMRLGSGMAFYF